MKKVLALAASAVLIALSSGACSKGSDVELIVEGNDSGATLAGDDGADGGGLDDATGPNLTKDTGASDAYNFLEAGCATATAQAKRKPVYMLIVLDGSGSMGDDNKWAAIVPALDATFDDLLAQADHSFGAGLLAFSDAQDPSGGDGPYPQSNDVFIAFVDKPQHDLLRGRIDGSGPGNGTPTLKALQGGYHLLENLVTGSDLDPGGKKVLVLMTDGVPNGGSTEQNSCTTLAATELAKGGPAGPIQTFAVGIGPFPSSDTGSYDPAFMGAMAKAGGTSPYGCNPAETSNLSNICHFQVDPTTSATAAQLKQKFLDAINRIRSQLTSCEFALQDTAGNGTVDPSKVNVIFVDGNGNDHIIPEASKDGWHYDDPTNPKNVILDGQACDEVMLDPTGHLSVVLGCKSVTN